MDYLPPPEVNVVVTNQGMSKGILNENGVQVIAGLRLSLGDHLYVGGEVKNTDSTIGTGEAKLAVGLRGTIAGVNVTGEIARKQMLDPVANTDTKAFEYTVTASKTIGRVNGTLSAVYSPNDFGTTGRSLYTEGTVRYNIGGGVNLVGALGHRNRDNAADYTSYSGGVEVALNKHMTAQVRYYDTSEDALGEVYKHRVVGGIAVKF